MRRNSLMYILLLLASLLLTTFAASDIYADLIDILSIQGVADPAPRNGHQCN